MFITVRDKSKTCIINMNEIVCVERHYRWVNFIPSSESTIELIYDSEEEAVEALKEISLLIEEKQQK